MGEFISTGEADILNLQTMKMPIEQLIKDIQFEADPLDPSRYLIDDGRKGVVSISREELIEMGMRKRFIEAYGGVAAVRAARVSEQIEQEAASRNGEWI